MIEEVRNRGEDEVVHGLAGETQVLQRVAPGVAEDGLGAVVWNEDWWKGAVDEFRASYRHGCGFFCSYFSSSSREQRQWTS